MEKVTFISRPTYMRNWSKIGRRESQLLLIWYGMTHEGFSEDNDVMLMEAAQVDTCAERDKYVNILMDEMYIREDIVYEKHSGKMIGFANLGDVNNRLAILEQRLQCTTVDQSTKLSSDRLVAKRMMVFMVRGKSVIEIVQYVFTVPGVDSVLSQRLCQYPLEGFFGHQRQRGGVHDNPNTAEFLKNTQAVRVIGSLCPDPVYGNCRGSHAEDAD
eukprot:Em0005g612a